MNDKVAALFVEPLGPYPMLVKHWYDKTRDATKYNGPYPVVAHPPCGPWGRLYHLCTKQDPSLALKAVDIIHKFGGVLEHPVDSKLWKACKLPKPNEFTFGRQGWTLYIEQWWFGHKTVKPTWLYIVGTEQIPPLPEIDKKKDQSKNPGLRKSYLVRH